MAAFTTSLLIGLVAGSTATQVVGQVKAGNAAKRAGEGQQRAANSEADILDYNAGVSDLQARDALERGAIDESRFRSQVRGIVGSQRAGYAAQGVSVASGSAADVQADASYLGELDALQLRQNAMREAWGFKVSAYDARAQADIARKEGVVYAEAGRAQQAASRYAAAGTILGAGGSLLLSRYGFKNAVPAQIGDVSARDAFAYGGLG